MSVNRQQISAMLDMLITSVYGVRYKQLPVEYTQVFETRSSSLAQEEHRRFWGTGYASVKDEGDVIVMDSMGQGETSRFVHDTVALGIKITKEAVDDAKHIRMVPQAGQFLAHSMKRTKDLRAINVLNNATDTGFLGGDGKPLLATDHPLAGPGGGTYANTLSVQARMSEAALEELLILSQYAVDDRGLPAMIEPKRFVTAKARAYDLHRILKSIGRPGTADNDANALKDMNEFSGAPALLRHLTNTQFWGFTTDCPDGLIHYERQGRETYSRMNPDTLDHEMRTTYRDSNGWMDPRGFYGCAPA